MTPFKNIFLSAMFLIPLNHKGSWQTLSFSNIPDHKINFSKSGLMIDVNQSAMPLIYPFNELKEISALHISLEAKGLPQLIKNRLQGEGQNDDFALRVGLVIAGPKKLNWFQRTLAASWVTTLYDLAPEGTGIDHIQFYNAVEDKSLLGTQRVHPKSHKLIKENYYWHLDKSGPHNLKINFKTPKKALALWISTDGDDTRSKYQIQIKSLSITSP